MTPAPTPSEVDLKTREALVRVLLAAALVVGVIAAAGCTTSSSGPSSSGQGRPSAPATVPAQTPAPPPPAPPAPTDPKPISGLKAAGVVRVVDGDTAVLAVGGRQERVRFIGVDTPESTTQHEPYGEEASKYTKRVLEPGRKVYLEYDAELRDRYGRLLAYVWLEPPSDRSDASLREKQFNARLLLHGYAQQMTIQPNSKYADLYTVYAREARQQNRGLWALSPTSSSGAPSTPKLSASGSYVGTRRSMKFHTRQCQWGKQIAAHNLVVFANRAEAINAGYVPCKVCKP